jgi:hypothetical protein
MAQATSKRIQILAAVLGVVMIGSGVSKLAGESHQVAMFAQVRLHLKENVWDMQVLSSVEVQALLLRRWKH